MEKEIKEIPFYGNTLLGIKDESGQIWLAITSACKGIGFDERRIRGQGEKIRADRVLSKGIQIFGLPSKGGIQETFCIQEQFVPLWLAKITITKKLVQEIPQLADKLEKYQLEAMNVLHKAFMGTTEKKQEFFSDMNIHGEIADLKQEVTQMKESIDQLIESSTINTTQQQAIHRLAKDKINNLLGGAHSWMYRTQSKSYFSNLWNNFKERFHCASYRDLNPKDFMAAKEFINNWPY